MYPAVHSDGGFAGATVDQYDPPEGACLRVKSTITESDMTTLGLSDAQLEPSRETLRTVLQTNPACRRLAPLPAPLVAATDGDPSYAQLQNAADAVFLGDSLRARAPVPPAQGARCGARSISGCWPGPSCCGVVRIRATERPRRSVCMRAATISWRSTMERVPFACSP